MPVSYHNSQRLIKIQQINSTPVSRYDIWLSFFICYLIVQSLVPFNHKFNFENPRIRWTSGWKTVKINFYRSRFSSRHLCVGIKVGVDFPSNILWKQKKKFYKKNVRLEGILFLLPVWYARKSKQQPLFEEVLWLALANFPDNKRGFEAELTAEIYELFGTEQITKKIAQIREVIFSMHLQQSLLICHEIFTLEHWNSTARPFTYLIGRFFDCSMISFLWPSSSAVVNWGIHSWTNNFNKFNTVCIFIF